MYISREDRWVWLSCVYVFSSELLSGAVNRLGGDVLELCPGMKDKEDEEEIQQNFCFVLADELERDGIISYHAKRQLDLDDLVLPLFASSNSTACLMLHTTGQDHGLERSGHDDDTAKVEITTTAVSDIKETEEERREAALERQRWRQQGTVIFNGHGDYPDNDQFEEEEASLAQTEPSGLDSPSKSVPL